MESRLKTYFIKQIRCLYVQVTSKILFDLNYMRIRKTHKNNKIINLLSVVLLYENYRRLFSIILTFAIIYFLFNRRVILPIVVDKDKIKPMAATSHLNIIAPQPHCSQFIRVRLLFRKTTLKFQVQSQWVNNCIRGIITEKY